MASWPQLSGMHNICTNEWYFGKMEDQDQNTENINLGRLIQTLQRYTKIEYTTKNIFLHYSYHFH